MTTCLPRTQNPIAISKRHGGQAQAILRSHSALEDQRPDRSTAFVGFRHRFIELKAARPGGRRAAAGAIGCNWKNPEAPAPKEEGSTARRRKPVRPWADRGLRSLIPFANSMSTVGQSGRDPPGSIDRLGRSLQNLVGFLPELHALGIDLFLHQQGPDTTTPAGKAISQMPGVLLRRAQHDSGTSVPGCLPHTTGLRTRSTITGPGIVPSRVTMSTSPLPSRLSRELKGKTNLSDAELRN